MKKIILVVAILSASALSARAQSAKYTEEDLAKLDGIFNTPQTVFVDESELKTYESANLGDLAKSKAAGRYVYDTSLIRAVKAASLDSVRTLLQARVDPNEKNDDGYTPMAIAAQYGYTDILNELYANGGDINLASVHNITPLIMASANGHIKAVKFLVERAALIDATDTLGKTAFLHASENGHLDVVKYLYANRANFFKTDSFGDNALTLAIKNEQDAVAVYLLKNGASAEFVDGRESTVAGLARKHLPGSKTEKQLNKIYKASGRQPVYFVFVNEDVAAAPEAAAPQTPAMAEDLPPAVVLNAAQPYDAQGQRAAPVTHSTKAPAVQARPLPRRANAGRITTPAAVEVIKNADGTYTYSDLVIERRPAPQTPLKTRDNL